MSVGSFINIKTKLDSGLDISAIFSGDPLLYNSKQSLFNTRTITLIRCNDDENGNCLIIPS